MKKKPVYSAVFLDAGAMHTLRSWFEQETGLSALPVEPSNPHLTVAIKPSPEEVTAMPLGYEVHLTVTGWAADESGQALTVRGFPSDKQHPHVTLALAPGVTPNYSDRLLAQGITPAHGPTVVGTIGYYDGHVHLSLPIES
jgi:hypothetical protein